MKSKNIADKIVGLKNADLELRRKLVESGRLGEGYGREMQDLHNRNAQVLDEIVNEIGYPTVEKVGEEANEAAWLVIQHAIGKPEFMRKCLELLEKEVSDGRANPQQMAYLTDRIAVFEGRPQLYGTQFDWDKNSELSPNSVDNPDKVNERRKAIGLNTLEEQTAAIRTRARLENQSPPADFEKRRQGFEEWKISVGWKK
jgi:hypothetical protein